MTTYYPATIFPPQFINPDDGELASGFTISAYLAGTTTPTAMFTDKNGTSAGVVVTLNSGGWPEVSGSVVVIWLQRGVEYKFILRDADGATEWTLDHIEDGDASTIEFIQSGTGAVATDVQTKLRERLSVIDFGADPSGVGDSTTAFLNAAATGREILLSEGEFKISGPVTLYNVRGEGSADGKTVINLTGSGQLSVGDWYCHWEGFQVRSSVNNKVMVKNDGQSYWTFRDFLINKTYLSGATGQVGIEFSTSSSSIYFNRVDDFAIRVDYPVKISGNSTQVFNANKIGGGVGGNKWFDFQSAITIDAGVLAADANEFGGYFESGVNVLTFNGVALRQNRFRIIQDAVTRIWNSAVAITDKNLWEILDGGFTYTGTYPQNQEFIGVESTKVRATQSTAQSINNASLTVLTYDQEVYDTLSEFTPGTGVFTAKNAGYYNVTGGALSANVAWPAGTRWEARIYKNGVEYAKGDFTQTDAAVTNQKSSYASAMVYLNGTTDTIDVRLIHNQGAAVAVDTAPTANYIQIVRV